MTLYKRSNKIADHRRDRENYRSHDHNKEIELNVRRQIHDQRVDDKRNYASHDPAHGAFDRFLGADVGNELMFAEFYADKVRSGIGDPVIM